MQIFVYTLGYSRRGFAVAFRAQSVREWIAGHELAFQHFRSVRDRKQMDRRARACHRPTGGGAWRDAPRVHRDARAVLRAAGSWRRRVARYPMT